MIRKILELSCDRCGVVIVSKSYPIDWNLKEVDMAHKKKYIATIVQK